MASGTPGPPDISTVLTEQNPWHLDGSVPDILAPPVERPLAAHLWQRLTSDGPRRFLVVVGARRVGKTTVMYQTVRHLLRIGVSPRRLWWMRLDHPVLLRVPLDVLVRRAIDLADATAERPVHLFLDELVYAEDWDLWLKTFYDERWPVRLVATSSAAAALRGRRLESGIGRWLDLYLPPYAFSEFLDLVGSPTEVRTGASLAEVLRGTRPPTDPGPVASLRRRFLLAGGFPELLIAERDSAGDDVSRVLRSQQQLRSDAVEKAVYKDIPQSYGIDSPMALERLLYVVADQATGLLSPTKIASELGMSQPTVERYLHHLQQAFLVFTLPGYSGNEHAVQRRGRKVYFVDGAVRNAALQRGTAPLADPVESGVLMENAAAAALHAVAEQTGHRLYHWRDRNLEVDLVLDDPARPLAFEIASSARHPRAGLEAFLNRHPRFRGGCYLVAPDIPGVDAEASHTGIGTLALDTFLVACGHHAAEGLRHRLVV